MHGGAERQCVRVRLLKSRPGSPVLGKTGEGAHPVNALVAGSKPVARLLNAIDHVEKLTEYVDSRQDKAALWRAQARQESSP